MKTFFISLAFFLLLLAVVVLNYIYINGICDGLTELADALESELCDERISALEECWEKHQTLLCFSVNYEYINNISGRISSIRALFDANDAFVLREVALLKEDIKEMRKLESLSPQNIL